MKRYTFRLATVLRIRRAEEARDRDQLMAANNRLRELIEQRDVQLRRYETLFCKCGTTTVEDFSSIQLGLELAARSVAQAQRRVTESAAEAAMAQVAWFKSSREVAVIERLDERRRAEHQDAERKADGDLVDDLITTRFVLGQLANQIESAS